MNNKFRKDTTVGISKQVKEMLSQHLPEKTNVCGWMNEAVIEKIERERTQETPTLERQIKR